MQCDFELHICIFDINNENTCLGSPNMQNLTVFFFDLRIRWPELSDFGPKSDDLGHHIFKSKNGMVPKFEMLSTTARKSRAIDELDGDTAGCRRCVAPDAQSVGGAFLHGQTSVGWRGLGPRYTRRAPLRGYVLDCSSSSSQAHCVKVQNTKTG